LTQVFVRFPNATATTGGHVFPNLVPPHVFVDIGVLGANFGPIALQFFGHQHGQARHGALTQFGASDANDDAVIGLNDDPMRDFCDTTAARSHGGWRLETQDQGAGECRGLLQKLTAIRTLQ
jgi:hypothetical protein